jgi:hypothetical protein
VALSGFIGRHWPMQAHGAEMMRLAACLATERGVDVCCPVHDAFLIEADADRIDAETARTQECMHEASELVPPGFSLRTDTKVVRYPDCYSDPRGKHMWELVRSLLGDDEDSGTPCTAVSPTPCTDAIPLVAETPCTDEYRRGPETTGMNILACRNPWPQL